MNRQKLDGLIAQNFFGWQWKNIDFGWSNGHRGFLIPPEGQDPHKAEKEWEGQYLKSMPQFSTSKELAQQLKDKLNELKLLPDSQSGQSVEALMQSPRDLSFAALATKGLRFRKKEIEALPKTDDEVPTYRDEKNGKFYQVQADQNQFRESTNGINFGSWKRFDD